MTKGLHKGSLRKVDNPHQWMIDDARMELIQQIKAEVERLKEENNNIRCDSNKAYCQGYDDALVDLLASLSTLDLEKPTLQEQPVCEEFDKEFSKFSNDVDAEHPFPICVDEYKDFARHFYELGRQSECVKVKAESSIDKFILENCTHCTIEHCPGMRECYTSSNKQLQ